MRHLLAAALWALCCLSHSSAESGRNPDAAALVQSAVRVHREAEDEEAPDPQKAAGAKDHAAAKRAPAAKKPSAKPAAAAKGQPAKPASAQRAAPKIATTLVAQSKSGGAAVATQAAARVLKTSLQPRGTGDAIDGKLSAVLLRRGEPCEEACAVTWGDEFSMAFNADMPKGLQPGDKVSWHAVITPEELDQENSFHEVLHAEPITVDLICEFCRGSCTSELVSASMGSLKTTAPTQAISNDYCADDGSLKVGLNRVPIMREWVFKIPSGLGKTVEAIRGEVDWEMSILRKTGLRRAFTTKHGHLVPHRDSPVPSSLAQVSAESFRLLSGAVRDLRGLGGPMALTEAFFHALSGVVAAELPRGAAELSLLGSKGEVLGGDGPGDIIMVQNLQINEIAQGSNYSWVAEGCETTDEKGSYSCAYPLGATLEGAMHVHLAANIEPGATIKVKVEKPVAEGLVGMMVSSVWHKLGKMEWSVPMCGPEYTAALGDERVTMPSANCGYFALDLTSPMHSFTMLSRKDFRNLYLPGDTKFPEMALSLVWKAATRAQIVQKDGRVVFDATYETGFQRR